MNANTTKIFTEIEQTLIDVDSEVGGTFFDDMEKFTQLTDETVEGLEKSIDEIDSTVKLIDETIEEFEEKVKNLGAVKPNTPEATLLAKYNRYLSGLKKMKLALDKRKTALKGLKETASMDPSQFKLVPHQLNLNYMGLIFMVLNKVKRFLILMLEKLGWLSRRRILPKNYYNMWMLVTEFM